MISKILVTTTNDDINDFENLFDMFTNIRGTNQEFLLDFSDCKFLRHNAVALLGALIGRVRQLGGTVSVNWETVQEEILINLKQNGFFGYCNTGSPDGWPGNSVPFRVFINNQHNEIITYLQEKWLRPNWTMLTQDIVELVLSRVWEIFDNAFTHSRSKTVFTCGQYYKTWTQLRLCLVDLGVGIPHKVNKFLLQAGKITQPMPASEAIQWAMEKGHTTSTGESYSLARGLGLDILRAFIADNKGELLIFSGDGCIKQIGGVIKQQKISTMYQGTVINIAIRCDNSAHRAETLEKTTIKF